jgi:hypothetical protein
VEPADRDEHPRRAAGTHRRVIGAAAAKRREEIADIGRPDRGDVVDPARVKELEIPSQVAAVRRHRVRREPALDPEVVEVRADRARRVLRAQASTSASGR